MNGIVVWRTAQRLAAVVGMLFMASCSLVYDTDEVQCDTDADCVSRGFVGATCSSNVCQKAAEVASEWSCLGKVKWPSTGDGPFKLRAMVIDVMTSKPPEDLEVVLCPKLDTECTSPSPANATTTADGYLEVTVSAGFDGYLQMTAPTITPALFFPVKPVFEDTVIPGVLPVVSPQGFAQIATAIGTTLDLTLGHTYVMASNCDNTPAPGVRLEVSDQTATTKRYYMINNAPVGSATSTDSAGNGGFLNLEPKFTKITGFVASTGAMIGEASFVVRAGAVTYPRILPTQ